MAERRETVKEFCISRNYSIDQICDYAGLSRSCYYYQRFCSSTCSPGRPVPGYTVNRDGAIILDQTLVQVLKEYRESVFFLNAGGSKKLSKYIAIEKHIYVNHKKIYRLCDENNFLLFKQDHSQNRKRRKTRCEYMEVSRPNELWQFDLKYIWIHGEQRWCFLLAFIDVFSKKVVGYYIGKSCKSGDLIFTLNQAIQSEKLTHDNKLVIRSDNGPQMSSNRFHFYLKKLEQKLSHEFIPPRSPDRNAYIEAFNSIIEIELLQVRYFKTFKDAYEAVSEFIYFYNHRRLHGSIGNQSPNMFLEAWHAGNIAPYSISA